MNPIFKGNLTDVSGLARWAAYLQHPSAIAKLSELRYSLIHALPGWWNW